MKRVYVDGLCLITLADGSLVYYYKIQHRGQIYSGSTRTSSKQKAIEFVEALKTELREKHRRGDQTPLSLPTLERIHDEWLEIAETQFSEGHRESFDSWWRLHLQPHLGRLTLDRISTKAVETTRAKYLAEGGGPGGANSLLKVLRTLLNFAIRRRYLVRLPFDVSRLQVQRKPRPVLPAEIVPKFLAEIDRSRNPNVAGIIRLMLGLGLRENEALNARWEDLDLVRKTYQPARTKSGKSPMLPVPDWLAGFLKKARGDHREGWMFPSEDGEPHRIGFTRKPIERAGKAFRLGHLTPHRLRATFATLHADAGTDLRKIQALLGHSEIETTMRYVEDSSVGLREAQAALASAMGLAVSSKSAGKRRSKPPQTTSGTNSGTTRNRKAKVGEQVKSKQH